MIELKKLRIFAFERLKTPILLIAGVRYLSSARNCAHCYLDMKKIRSSSLTLLGRERFGSEEEGILLK